MESSLDAEQLRRLVRVGAGLVAELDLDAVLRSLLETARDLTGARYAAVGVLDDERVRLERFLTVGIDEEAHRAIGDLPHGRGVLGVLIRDPRPLRLADVGAHPASYGFPLGHPPMTTFLGVPIVIRGRAWGNLYLTEKAAGEFTEADEEAIVVLAGWAATAIENARLYRVESVRRAELERAVRGLETTTEIARAVGGETDLARLLELIVKRGRALVEARAMAILLGEADDLVVAATAGALPPAMRGERLPLTGSVAEFVMGSGRAERSSDLPARLEATLRDRIEGAAGLWVPLRFRGRSLGVLAAFDRLTDGPEFSPEDQRLMEAFAASAATAVATAQSAAVQGLRRSIEASERERTRWARELHDETLQELAALKLTLNGARRRAEGTPLAATLEAAVAQVTGVIGSLRSLITDLRPAALDALGPQPALEGLVDRLRGRTDVAIELSVDLDYEAGRSAARHAPAVEDALYRLTQEALTNALKHAQAERIEVAIREHDGLVTLEVTDDGRGYDEPDAGEGFGLVGMRERAALLGGSVSIERRAGGGTLVRAVLPAVRADEQAPGDLVAILGIARAATETTDGRPGAGQIAVESSSGPASADT